MQLLKELKIFISGVKLSAATRTQKHNAVGVFLIAQTKLCTQEHAKYAMTDKSLQQKKTQIQKEKSEKKETIKLLESKVFWLTLNE